MRTGDWIQTFRGVQFWPLDPRPEELLIEDIAHALSMQCRFTGHVREFYSVAEHSVRVSNRAAQLAGKDEILAALLGRWGLMHDASETYLFDLARPVKHSPGMVGYREAEARLMSVICERFHLPQEEPKQVRLADNELLSTEARDLMGPRPAAWRDCAEPLPHQIQKPWTHGVAEQMFLDSFRALFPEENRV